MPGQSALTIDLEINRSNSNSNNQLSPFKSGFSLSFPNSPFLTTNVITGPGLSSSSTNLPQAGLPSPNPHSHTNPLPSPSRMSSMDGPISFRKSSLDEQRFVKQRMNFNNSKNVPYENLNMDYIAQLTSEGYTHDAVIRALGITRNDVKMACDILHEFATKKTTETT